MIKTKDTKVSENVTLQFSAEYAENIVFECTKPCTARDCVNRKLSGHFSVCSNLKMIVKQGERLCTCGSGVPWQDCQENKGFCG